MDYNIITTRIHPEWNEFIEENKKELMEILAKVSSDNNVINNVIYPKQKDIFKTLFYFGPEDTKLVILGQDPYIGEISLENLPKIGMNIPKEFQTNIGDNSSKVGKNIPQAHGFAFSVPKSHTKIPPSLKNIFKEIKNCYPNYNVPTHGNLKRWVKKEKIILLNCALTVIKGHSNSHIKLWESYTDKLIKYISDKNNKTIFLLMGNFAISKSKLVDTNKHMIFTTKHPSPLSAHNGFFGSNIFKNINDYLEENNMDIIQW
jgi:uracil-DNA glycosylase